MHYDSLASRERDEKGSQREPTGAKTKPNGSQWCAKRIGKRIQQGAIMKKYPLRNRSEQVGKKDAKRMTMYAKGVPTWSQNRCPKSLKDKEKTRNETTHVNHEK